MCRRLTSVASLVMFLALASTCGAKVRLAFDVGGCGPLQDGWIAVTSCGTYTDVGNTNIDVTLAVDARGEREAVGY